jgi:hypothetical protein
MTNYDIYNSEQVHFEISICQSLSFLYNPEYYESRVHFHTLVDHIIVYI